MRRRLSADGATRCWSQTLVAPDRSQDVERLVADLDSAGNDRELIDRFDAALLSSTLDDQTRRAFALEAHATGWLERVNAARDREMTRTVEAIEEDHKRRMDAVEARVLEALDAAGDPSTSA